MMLLLNTIYIMLECMQCILIVPNGARQSEKNESQNTKGVEPASLFFL